MCVIQLGYSCMGAMTLYIKQATSLDPKMK